MSKIKDYFVIDPNEDYSTWDVGNLTILLIASVLDTGEVRIRGRGFIHLERGLIRSDNKADLLDIVSTYQKSIKAVGIDRTLTIIHLHKLSI